MRATVLLVLCATAFAAASLNVFGYRWIVEQPADWSVENGVLRLVTSSEPPPGQPRRPTHFALAETPMFRRVTVEAEMKRNGKSLIIVYAWQDKDHYNYAHISSDTAVAQNYHNGMFHIFRGERVRISALDGPESLASKDWTPVKLVFNGDSGLCYVEVNGKRNPSLEAVDLSLKYGRVGLGSFDETGDFRKVKITGDPK